MLARGDLALEADIRSDTAPARRPGRRPARRRRRRRGGCATRRAAASAPSATSWPATPDLAVVLDEAAPARRARRSPARATCSASTRSTWPTRARWSRSSRPTRPTPRSRALRAHPLGARRGADRRDRGRARRASSCCARRSAAPASSTCSSATRCPGSAEAAVAPHAVAPRHRHRAGRRLPPVRLPPRGRARARRVRCATTAPGVLIDVEGDPAGIAELERRPGRRRRRRWPASRSVDGRAGRARRASATASASSRADAVGAADDPVSIDTATCADCLAEVDDPADRRYRYPFTNCTNCGPRYTIVLARALRPAGHDHGRLHDVPGVPGRVRRPGRPPLPRPAQRLPGLRAARWPGATPDGGAPCRRRRRARRRRRRAARAARSSAVKGIGGYHLAVDADRRATPSPSCAAARRATTSRSR